MLTCELHSGKTTHLGNHAIGRDALASCPLLRDDVDGDFEDDSRFARDNFNYACGKVFLKAIVWTAPAVVSLRSIRRLHHSVNRKLPSVSDFLR